MDKKTMLPGLLLGLVAVGWAQSPADREVRKNLLRVEQRQAVPERWQAGYEDITARGLESYLRFLADDALNGRETATPDFLVAAKYAASLFQLWGLSPAGDLPAPAPAGMMGSAGNRAPKPGARGYTQRFALKEITDVRTEMTVVCTEATRERRLAFHENVDFTALGQNPGTLSAPVVFAGYGLREEKARWDDYRKLDVKDKWVLVLAGAPGRGETTSPFWQDPELRKKYFPEGPMRRDSVSLAKLTLARKLGAVGVLVVRPTGDEDLFTGILDQRRVRDDRPILSDQRRRFTLPGAPALMPFESTPLLSVSRELADALLASGGRTIAGLVAPRSSGESPSGFTLPGVRLALETRAKEALVSGVNVVAAVPGSDPQLKGETVVVGAHLDHLGRQGDYVFNGANDNGSGSAAVLAIAKALMTGPQRPKRTVVLALWSGEEQGLFGSRHYVADPPYPLAGTVAYLNLDMVACPWNEASLRRMARMFGVSDVGELLKGIQADNFLTFGLTGENPALTETLRKANETVGFDLLLRPAPRRLDHSMGGSDHSSFAVAGVPWVFFMSGMGEGTYHQPKDEIETVDLPFFERMTRLVYLATVYRADL